MATHSSVLALRIPGTVEPGGLRSMGSHRVGHDWSDLAVAAAAAGETTWIWSWADMKYWLPEMTREKLQQEWLTARDSHTWTMLRKKEKKVKVWMRLESKNNNNNIQRYLFSCTRNTAFCNLFFFFLENERPQKLWSPGFPWVENLYIYLSVNNVPISATNYFP